MHQLVPLLERLVASSEALHEDLAPINSLAAKIPGSGARRRRRERRHALESGAAAAGAAQLGPAGTDVGAGALPARALEAPPTEDDLPPAASDSRGAPPTP
ncbi:MAG: hypothetical protein ITG02_02070 [Patulibacter sp.]|nr:hypothetical protein [Patulibacter sp.]